MGSNIARNFARHGYTVALHNRSIAKTDALLAQHGSDGNFVRSETIAEFLAALQRPQVVHRTLGDRHDDVPAGDEFLHGQSGGAQCGLVGHVAEDEVVGEKDDPRRVGVGQSDGALVGMGHGGNLWIFGPWARIQMRGLSHAPGLRRRLRRARRTWKIRSRCGSGKQ